MLSMAASGAVGRRHRALRRGFLGAVPLGACGIAVLCAASGAARGFTATLTPYAPQTIYLQVGVGAFTNDYIYGGQPENNSTVNTVSVTVAGTALGSGAAQAMTTNSTAANSYWDGYLFCNVPSQLYIGGFFRTAGGSTTPAQVTASVPSTLNDTSGDSIPFSQIAWTSGGNGDTGAEPFPAGTFVSGGTQTVGSMASNTWNESCWTFSFLNSAVHPAGTYTGTVVYTMTAP